MSELAFYGLAVATVVSAGGVVVLRNPVHCAMSLVLALFLIAINFIMLDAHLVAALQIIVYAGAVMVLFLFVIMLLNLQADAGESSSLGVKLLGVGAGAALALFLSRVVARSHPPGARAPGEELAGDFGTTEALARVLFRDHAVAFELTSVMLLVAVVGAVVLARRERA